MSLWVGGELVSSKVYGLFGPMDRFGPKIVNISAFFASSALGTKFKKGLFGPTIPYDL